MSSILLANRREKSQVIWYVLFGIYGMILYSIATKGCSPVEEKPRYSKLETYAVGDSTGDGKGLYAIHGIERYDSIKPFAFTTTVGLPIPVGYDSIKPPKINHRLILSGSDTTFRFLVFAIQNPNDITPNQKTQLLNWINTVKLDTTYAKK